MEKIKGIFIKPYLVNNNMGKLIRRIDLKIDGKRHDKLRKLKVALEEKQGRKILWTDFVYNSVTEFFKLQNKKRTNKLKNGKRKSKS